MLLKINQVIILLLNVIYSGDNSTKKLDDLVVYENIFDGKIFAREASDIFSELSLKKQEEFNQIYKVQKLTEEEVQEVSTDDYKVKKLEYIKNKQFIVL